MNNFRAKTWFLILSAAIALTLTFTLHAGEKTLKVSKGGKLEINVSNGDILLKTWDRNEVFVKYQDDGYDDEEGNVDITQNGNIVKITSGSFGTVISVTMPGEFNADVKTSAGDIELKGNLVGKLTGKTSGGDIDIENINGTLEASTLGGNIKLGFARGTVNVKTGGGDMRTGDVEGDMTVKIGGGNVLLGKISRTLKIKTGGGNIKITEIGGNAIVSTGGGNISINNTNGNIDVNTGGGDIKLNNTKGEIKAKTGSGRIFLGSVSNKIEVYTGAGDAEIVFTSGYKGISEIKTGYGNIDLIVPESVKATITAKVNSWELYDEDEEESGSLENITSDYKAAKIDKSGSEVTAVYNINGGGNNISVIAGNGEISIKKNK